MCGIANSLFGVEVACVAWRFKQFERERTKRRSRENERRSREEAAPYRGFPAFLAPSNCLIKNRQATQASVEETRGFMSRPEKFKNAA